jgi:transcription initiation factor TFIIIB Brf1 subunit/transcription initiation factor TFIIB
LCEVERCTECGSKNILYDETIGEAVCRNCGLVLGAVEFTAPADRVTKSTSSSPIAYTSAAVGAKIPSYHRLEVNAAYEIERVIQHLCLPQATKLLAITYVRRLRRAMRHQTDPKIRFTQNQLTALATWAALKQLKHPMNCNEFSQKIMPILGEVNLMKTEKRTLQFIEPVPRISDVPLVTAHINRIVKTLANKEVINNHYSHILGKYAVEMVHVKDNLVRGRKSDLIAASAVFAADGLIAECFTLRVFAEFVNVGAGNLSAFAEIFKRSAPPVPKESAAIHFTENLFRGIF